MIILLYDAYIYSMIHCGSVTDRNEDLGVIWFFPYFMETRIKQCLPSFTMLDYKVRVIKWKRKCNVMYLV